MESQIAKSGFNQVREKSDFETAVMIFQDKIPEADRKEFNIQEWIIVMQTASPKSRIKKEAWENIERLAEELKFSEAKNIFTKKINLKIDSLMLDIMCLLASNPIEINYCINLLSKDNPARKALLERLSVTDGLFIDWTAVFLLNSDNTDVQREAFSKAKKTEATFEEWETFDKECRKAYRESYYKSYLSQRFAEMRKRADTFRKKFAVYNAFKDEKPLVAEILKDMENTAEKPSDLVWVYERTKSESVKKKILTAQDTFDNWLYVNQISDEDWLKELSLKRMKEMAESHYHWSVIWCRESSESGKIKAVSNMIKMSKDVSEAKLTYHRASGTSLEKKAREKLKEIVIVSAL